MSVFQMVKDNVDILDAAQRYGMDVRRNNKALCPFHGDTNPSLSFKGTRYTCFSCGAGGDVIDLVGYLIQARSPMEAVKELNSAYRLGIDLERPADRTQIERLQRARAEKAAFLQWEQDACNRYARYCRALRDWMRDLAPRTINEPRNPLFLEACTKLDYMEYLYETIFINGSVYDKKQFYLSHWLDVALLKQRFGKERANEAVGRVAGSDRPHGNRGAVDGYTAQVV